MRQNGFVSLSGAGASHCRSTPVAGDVSPNCRLDGKVSPWSIELDSDSWASDSWSAKNSSPVLGFTASSVSPPPPVWQLGRLRAAQVRSSSRRNVLPSSSERDSWPVLVRLDKGQSTKIRGGSTAGGAGDPPVGRSLGACGYPAPKRAPT